MSQADNILDFIKRNCKMEVFVKGLRDGKNLGITAIEVQSEYGILRNNASSILNSLCKDGKLVKINSRPVTFLDKKIINELNEKYNVPIKTIYNFNELRDYLSNTTIRDPFEKLLGYNSSLLSQVRQAKAAIVYPPKGLHTLLLGESGVGKTTFAYAMHEYGLLINNKDKKEYPFVTFNCADYFNNPQLLLSQLFGHVKGAFTGADTEKVGLVEKANGGILFLDEVHRLPPDGQEMLFYLMDKGEYNRLGDSTKRKSNVLIVAATTEEPSTTLLGTFIRRVPVNIILPRYKDKPIAEKVEIIEQFFRFEAINLQQKIIISPEVLKALALYDFQGGNIGQLRSEIRLLCANAFLQHLQNKQLIYIGYEMLNKDIRDVLLNYLKIDKSIIGYLNMFSEDVVIMPNDKEDITYDIENDIYEIITEKLDKLKQKGVNVENITDVLKTDIDNYLRSISKHFNNTNPNLNNLYKLVSKEIVSATMQFIEYAREKLQVNFNNHFLFSLSLHIQELLKRIEDENVSSNPHLFKIKKEHPDEFEVANTLVKKISDKFGVIVPESEKGFLALLLFHSRVELSDNNKIGIIIVCHGNSTATSIANTCNTLLNTNMMKAIDMPLEHSIDETYKKLKTMALAINRGKGVIILADMGSLLSFDKKITADTGIKTKLVRNVSTPTALETLRHVLYDMEDIENVYEQVKFTDESNKIIPARKKELAILSVCTTGKGSSIIAKNILDELIEKYYADKIKIIPVEIEHVKTIFEKMKDKYYILAVVGTINPMLPIPFFPINQLMQAEIQQVFFHLLDGNINGVFVLPENKTGYTIFETAKDLLEKYVKFINPKHAISRIRKFIELVNYKPKNEEYVLDLIIHMGCMLDRCLSKIEIKYNNLEVYKNEEQVLFQKVKEALEDIENEYNVKISEDEVAYIVKIITTRV